MTDWIMTEEERRPDREIYYISEDDPVVKLMEAHKEALAEIERLRECHNKMGGATAKSSG